MAGTKSNEKSEKSGDDNRSRQLNPENDAYWRSRGEPGRPEGDGGGTTPAEGGGDQKPG